MIVLCLMLCTSWWTIPSLNCWIWLNFTELLIWNSGGSHCCYCPSTDHVCYLLCWFLKTFYLTKRSLSVQVSKSSYKGIFHQRKLFFCHLMHLFFFLPWFLRCRTTSCFSFKTCAQQLFGPSVYFCQIWTWFCIKMNCKRKNLKTHLCSRPGPPRCDRFICSDSNFHRYLSSIHCKMVRRWIDALSKANLPVLLALTEKRSGLFTFFLFKNEAIICFIQFCLNAASDGISGSVNSTWTRRMKHCLLIWCDSLCILLWRRPLSRRQSDTPLQSYLQIP